MKTRKNASSGAMLELWRPPQAAGDAVGCLVTTYTFAPGLFDEQCLARFLDIDSEPNREDLAFLLERESRLEGVYAGVLVDHTQAGVEHSLRWDILPVRIQAGKQHAKLSLLAWARHVRIIVASANLSEPGYRANYEVAAAVDLTPEAANTEMATAALAFLRSLVVFVPGSADRPPEVVRAEDFLGRVERQVRGWAPLRRRTVRQQLVVTLPSTGPRSSAASSLEQAAEECRRRGGSPTRARVASPFFDFDADTSQVTASLCKLMARGGERKLRFAVPAIRDDEATVPRLAAPRSLLSTPAKYQGTVRVEILPELDEVKNRRPWHAKMVAFRTDDYSALMIGSSNFTCAGMGVGSRRNAEANLLTIVDRVEYGREAGQLKALWPEMEQVTDPEAAEWLGARPEQEEEEQSKALSVPAGFLAATYRAGDTRTLILRLDPEHLPEDWRVYASGPDQPEILAAAGWRERGSPSTVELPWARPQPPERLRVQWASHEAFLTLNVEDSRRLPPPAQLDSMSADDMLRILAATDPSAAFRAWATRNESSDLFDPDLDSATPIDLDSLRRYDLQATFLHRIRRRARILAQLRSNLQRPVWGRQTLEWRLRGMVGIEPLADRLARECATAHDDGNEALLTLTDFLIVLREVDYQASDGSLSKTEFEKVFRPFLGELADKLGRQLEAQRPRLSAEMLDFWERVVARCRE